MKFETSEAFNPITITLESREEVILMTALFGALSPALSAEIMGASLKNKKIVAITKATEEFYFKHVNNFKTDKHIYIEEEKDPSVDPLLE